MNQYCFSLFEMNEIDFERMDLNLLKVFEALFEEGGAGRAAVRLGLTQSAVSAALGRMRRLYGNRLFERTGRGLRPTLLAHELRPVIAQALDKCRQSLALASADDSTQAMRMLVVGLSDDFEIAIGATLIEGARRRLPSLRLVLRQTHSLIVSDQLVDRELDLAVTAGGGASRLLSRQGLGTGDYACVLDGSRGGLARLELDEYLSREHILVSSGGFVGVVDDALKAQGLTRKIRASTTHFAALPHLLAGSDCVCTLPRHAALALARRCGLRYAECPLALPRFSVEMAWRRDARRDEVIAKFRTIVDEICQEHLAHER
ncbi:LysR substrate-binding domain-containing protein [Variovorax sp. HW608]|uniref:LysR substrate-binding domain-containing protein n=1 Tax=Variovorax sp. HW608 TaxID=1034889 RepID=UPI002F90D350